jgi:hypothetical protein
MLACGTHAVEQSSPRPPPLSLVKASLLQKEMPTFLCQNKELLFVKCIGILNAIRTKS